jgi:hypothetical protein
MLIDRITKEVDDYTRVEIDMSWWLDPGETIKTIIASDIGLGTTGWSETPFPPPGSPPPYDPTPIVFQSVAIDTDGKGLTVFLELGTPGNQYVCTFVLDGGSTRRVTVELAVEVLGEAPLVGTVPPTTPSNGNIGYAQLPAELSQVPVSFPFGGRPASSTVVNVPMGFSLRVPTGLAGTVTYAATKPFANATFVLNHLSGSTVIPLGTITLTPTTNTSCILVGSGGEIPAGDVLQIIAPVQDPTLADCGITIMTNRE